MNLTSKPAFGRGVGMGSAMARTTKDYKAVAALGSKVTRIMLPLDPRRKNDAELEALVNHARYARSHGLLLVVAIDWSRFGVANVVDVVHTWIKLARLLLSFRNVIFDIYNEPIPLAGLDQLQVEAANSVWAIDPNRRILLSLGGYGSPSGFDRPNAIAGLSKPKLAYYSVHMYEPHGFTHQGVADIPMGATYQPGSLRKLLAPVREFQLRHGLQIFVGEFSCVRWAVGREQWLAEFIALCREWGWGWCYHAWEESDLWDIRLSATSKTRADDVPAFQIMRRSLTA